ncbi:hypothetical protein ACFLUV_02950 [Elusimicrobiota bacterium]
MGIVEFEEFKGNAMIVLKNDEEDRYPFKFGRGKARKIVDNFDAIKKWVEEQEAVKTEQDAAQTEEDTSSDS